MTKDTHAHKHQHWQSSEAAGKALAGASWPSAAPVTTARQRETKTQSGSDVPVYLVYFCFTADTAADKRASCNTVHLEN